MRMSEFGEWLKTWALPKVTLEDIQSLFVLVDADRSDELEFDELKQFLSLLSEATLEAHRDVGATIARRVSTSEDEYDELLAMLNFVGLTEDEASFSAWLASQFPSA